MKKLSFYHKLPTIIILIVLSIMAYFALPSSPKTQPATAVWNGGQCNLDGQSSQNCCNNQTHVINRTGWTDTFSAGRCIDVNDTACPDGRVVPSNIWLCPGGNNIRCCVPIKQPPPTSVTASCPSGTTVTVNWTLPAGYSYAYPRITDTTTGTNYWPGPRTGTSYSISGTPGHSYSYWVHTTNAGGSPYSNEVPTAYTASITCAAPTPTPTPPLECGDNASPNGSVISTGVATTTSRVRNNDTATFGGQNVVDSFSNTIWNAGASPTQWVELDLGAPQQVRGLKLHVEQSPDGNTVTEIRAGASANPTSIRRTLSCYTRNGQTINVVFPTPLENVQYLQIRTTSGPSHVAWREVTVFGSAPGAQSTTPGIIFTGDASAAFGQGQASENQWIVGGLTYPEVYQQTSAIQTSYDYLLTKMRKNNITITNITTLTGCTSLTNCSLPASIQSGVYQANGNLNLNGFAFPVGRNYIFLVNGNLTVNGNIYVPNGSTAFFTSSNDIIVDEEVGTAVNLFPLPSGQLQGIFSADRDFLVEGINDCLIRKDKMLNVEGAIVTNAAGSGGTFRTLRDLCGDNPRYPALTIRVRLDMLLNIPEVLMDQRTTFREDAP